MRTFEDPIEDLHEDLGKIFEDRQILVKIFKDLSFSCQDLQGSLKILPRSSRIFHFPVKFLEDLVWIFKDLDKNFEDLQMIFEKIFEDLPNSCQDLQGSFIFLPRSSWIFHFPAKILRILSGSSKIMLRTLMIL